MYFDILYAIFSIQEVSGRMIEIISKLSEMFKASSIPLFLLTAIHSTNVNIKEEKKLKIEDAVPGDNFPYVAMSWGI